MKPLIIIITLTCVVLHSAFAQEGVNHTGIKIDLKRDLSPLIISDFLSKDVVIPKAKKNPSTLDERSFFWHTKIERKESKLSSHVFLIRNRKEQFFNVKMNDVYGGCEVSWASEKLLLIRVWWARHHGSDYLFDVDSGKIIYEEGFGDRHPEFGGKNQKREQDAAGNPLPAE